MAVLFDASLQHTWAFLKTKTALYKSSLNQELKPVCEGFLCENVSFPSVHCCVVSSVVSVLLSGLFWEVFDLESADSSAAALFFCDSSFAEGGRRMHMAAWPSRMTFGLETNPTIIPICCTIWSRDVSYGKKKHNKKSFKIWQKEARDFDHESLISLLPLRKVRSSSPCRLQGPLVLIAE